MKKKKKKIKKVKTRRKVKRNTFKKRRVRKNTFKKKISKKRVKKYKITRKKKQPLDRLKALKFPKIKIPKIKIKKRREFNIKKKLGQLTVNLINLALFPLFRAYDSYKSNQLKEKLRKEQERLKEQEREKKERIKLLQEQKKQELKDQVKFAEKAKTEMRMYLRSAERQARLDKAEQQKKILENLKINKMILKYEERSRREQAALERYALQNLKEDYEPIVQKIQEIKERYKKLQEEKFRKRLVELGADLKGDEDKKALLEAERQLIYEKDQISTTLLPYTRSLRTCAFLINRDHIGKNMSPLKIIDNSSETGEVFIKWMDLEDSDEFLILIYIKENSIKSGKIVCELKLNPEKYSTHEFLFKEIFPFQSKIIDEIIGMLERMKNEKKKINFL